MTAAQHGAEPRRPSPLDDCGDAFARGVLERGSTLDIGPQCVLDAGERAAGMSWDGGAFRVYGSAGDWRGTFASWGAAHAAMLDAAVEWEAGLGPSRT